MSVDIPLELFINTALTAVVGWAIKLILDQIKNYTKESKEWHQEMTKTVGAISDASRANMRAIIIHYCEKYISRNGITSEERASIADLYEKYKALNPHNNFVDGYIDRVSRLPDIEV